MNIKVLEPYGYCFGVKNALNKINEIINNNKNKEIILVGPLVHNRNTNDILINKGVNIIDNLDENYLLSYFKNIDTINKIIVLSCHGNYKKLKDYIIERNFTYFDLVCPIVEKNIKKINNSDFDKLIFIGNKAHIESKYLFSYTNKEIIDILNFKNDNKTKFLILNQTTCPLSSYEESIKNINNFKNIEAYKNICLEPYKRYENLKNEIKNNKYDFVFVVGDTTSANTKNLLNLYQNTTKMNNIKIINDFKDILDFNFNSNMSFLILSGTSASNEDVSGVINYLKTIK